VTLPRRAVRAAAALLALACLAGPLAADARADNDAPERQTMRFIESGESLLVIASITKIFDATAYERLDSGLRSTLVIRVYVYRDGKQEPVAYQLLRRQVVYDVWDEVYEVRLEGPGGRRDLRLKTRADALKAMTELDGLVIAPLADIRLEEHHVLGIVVELNPVSAETLAEIRRWLTQRATSTGLESDSSFFGSFVSVFVNPPLDQADRVIRIQSQPFFRPRR
jgi:uncharacterized protein DUF4390